MGAERCIVLLVVVVMGAGLFVVNSVVDEDIVKNYSEEVAAYNELHDETLLDTVMHKRIHSENDDREIAMEANRIRRSSGQGMDEDPEHDQEPKRSSDQGINEEPDHSRVKRSSGQGINEDPEHDQEEQSYNRANRSVAIKDTDVPHTKPKRSSGQGINEEPDHSRVKRSSGQGINEDPEHDQEEQSYNRASRSVAIKDTDVPHKKLERSSGQGIIEEPDNARVERSSGQGINEDPEHDQEEQSYNRASRSVAIKDTGVPHTKPKRSSGQDINEEPDHARVKRSSGQGINEDPEHDQEEQSYNRASRSIAIKDTDVPQTKPKRSSGQDKDGHNVARWLRSTQKRQGVRSNVEISAKSVPEKIRPKRSSGQGINEEDSNPEADPSFLETASNLDMSVEDGNVAEEDEEFIGDNERSNYNPNNIPSSPSDSSDILEALAVFEIDPDDDEQDGEAYDAQIEAVLPDSEQPEKTLTDKLIPCNEEFKPENGNDGDGVSHYDNNLNPYAYHYERENVDLDSSEDRPQMGYVLYNSENDDERVIKLNKGVDFVLGLMSTMFTGEGELTVDLPDINKKFGHGIMAGNFNATQGYFRNPATLHRTGDVDITKLGDTVSLEVALGLQTLDAGFQHYDLKILKIHQAGTIDVSVAQNSIKMKISLTYSPACNLTVDYVGLDQLDGIKVDITGLGAFQSMFDMLSKWFLDNFTGDFKNVVNKKLEEKAKRAVAREDICKYFPQ